MKKEYVAFLDSGIGGLSTLSATFPIKFNVLYYADNKFAPYGSLKTNFLNSHLQSIVKSLQKRHKIHTFVIACNTATTTCITQLRLNFPNLTFIGTEPAIKLAYKLGYLSPIVIATPQTIHKLSSSNFNNIKNVQLLKMPTFAKNIENYLTYPCPINYFYVLKDIFYVVKHVENHDCLVLGCTHYVLVKDIIEKFIQLPILDGNEGVAKQISLKVKEISENTELKFCFSQQKKGLRQKYKKILRQTLANKNIL